MQDMPVVLCQRHTKSLAQDDVRAAKAPPSPLDLSRTAKTTNKAADHPPGSLPEQDSAAHLSRHPPQQTKVAMSAATMLYPYTFL
jgi:hypothetical protein